MFCSNRHETTARLISFAGASTGARKALITTLISRTGNAHPPLAAKIFSKHSGDTINVKSFAELNGLSATVSRDAAVALHENRSRSVVYRDVDGSLEFFHEVINPPTAIKIFGAGHDAVPLAYLAANLGWKISVIDHRPAWADAARFPEADEIIVSRPESIADEVFTDVNSVAVVMNHNYDADRDIIRRLLGSTCRYIGVLGPKDRTAKLVHELGATRTDLQKLYSPVGLDIGATTPEGIALVHSCGDPSCTLGPQRGLPERPAGPYLRSLISFVNSDTWFRTESVLSYSPGANRVNSARPSSSLSSKERVSCGTQSKPR